MLLSQDQQSTAEAVASPEKHNWNFHFDFITEADVPDLVDITLKAFEDDAMTNGCFLQGVPPATRREEERRWREQKCYSLLRRPDHGQWCVKVVATSNDSFQSPSSWQAGFINENCSGRDSKEQKQHRNDGRIVGYAIWLDYSMYRHCEAWRDPGVDERILIEDPSCLDKNAFDHVCNLLKRTTYAILQTKKDVWYLEHLVTHPEFQRKGVGSMLMRWGVEQANIGRCGVYVEASRAGYRLYRNFGLERHSKIRFASGGYRIAMFREPVEW